MTGVQTCALPISDIQRIDQLWSGLREQHADQGDWLFGAFSIVDVMFAPVVLRFMTYGIELSPPAQAYANALRHHPAMQAWLADALLETEIVEEDEAGEPA